MESNQPTPPPNPLNPGHYSDTHVSPPGPPRHPNRLRYIVLSLIGLTVVATVAVAASTLTANFGTGRPAGSSIPLTVDVPTDPTPSPAATPAPTPLPNGFQAYQDDAFGYRFAYPKDWGVLSFQTTGAVTWGNFSGNTYIHLQLTKKSAALQFETDDMTYGIVDYAHAGSGYVLTYAKGGPTQASLTTVAADDAIASAYSDESNYLLYRGRGTGYYFHGLARLTHNPEYAIVNFKWSKGRTDRPFSIQDPEVAQLRTVLQTVRNQ